jgi:hypothetical protein
MALQTGFFHTAGISLHIKFFATFKEPHFSGPTLCLWVFFKIANQLLFFRSGTIDRIERPPPGEPNNKLTGRLLNLFKDFSRNPTSRHSLWDKFPRFHPLLKLRSDMGLHIMPEGFVNLAEESGLGPGFLVDLFPAPPPRTVGCHNYKK